jgi:hypothetical protein
MEYRNVTVLDLRILYMPPIWCFPNMPFLYEQIIPPSPTPPHPPPPDKRIFIVINSRYYYRFSFTAVPYRYCLMETDRGSNSKWYRSTGLWNCVVGKFLYFKGKTSRESHKPVFQHLQDIWYLLTCLDYANFEKCFTLPRHKMHIGQVYPWYTVVP